MMADAISLRQLTGDSVEEIVSGAQEKAADGYMLPISQGFSEGLHVGRRP